MATVNWTDDFTTNHLLDRYYASPAGLDATWRWAPGGVERNPDWGGSEPWWGDPGYPYAPLTLFMTDGTVVVPSDFRKVVVEIWLHQRGTVVWTPSPQQLAVWGDTPGGPPEYYWTTGFVGLGNSPDHPSSDSIACFFQSPRRDFILEEDYPTMAGARPGTFGFSGMVRGDSRELGVAEPFRPDGLSDTFFVRFTLGRGGPLLCEIGDVIADVPQSPSFSQTAAIDPDLLVEAVTDGLYPWIDLYGYWCDEPAVRRLSWTMTTDYPCPPYPFGSPPGAAYAGEGPAAVVAFGAPVSQGLKWPIVR